MATPRIFDCFTFFNEFDLLELRLQTLWDVVDSFVIVEANCTFTGKPKTYAFLDNPDRFKPYMSKIVHVKVEDMPIAKGAWACEHHQRQSIANGLSQAKPDDFIIVADADEIVKPAALTSALEVGQGAITIFVLEDFNFKLNLKAHRSKLNKGACMIQRKHFRSAQALREVRARRSYSLPDFLEKPFWTWDVFRTHRRLLNRVVVPNGAWHFSFVMDPEQIRTKMGSYAHVERNRPDELTDSSILGRIKRMRSMRDEPLSVVDLEHLPRPIAMHKSSWKHLLFDPIQDNLP